MNQSRRRQDYYKKNNFNSPPPERNRNSHHVSFGEVHHRQRSPSPIKREKQMHDVYTDHFRRQLPKVVNFSRHQMHTTYKSRKNKNNTILKHNYNRSSTHLEKESKYEKYKTYKKRSVYFEDSTNKSSDDMTSNLNSDLCKMSSVKNVINKFNKLSTKPEQFVPCKQKNNNKNEMRVSKESIPKLNQNTSDESLHNSTENYTEESSIEYIPITIIQEKNKEIKKTNKNNRKKEKKQLRSQWYIPQRNSSKNLHHQDHLLDLFKPNYKLDEIQKQICIKDLNQPDFEIEKDIKRVTSTHTQTTPCSSATNIMINVYNQKSPRLILRKNCSQNPLDINVFNEELNDSKNNSIKLKNIPKENNIEIIRQSVKSCIKKFEENLRKNGVDPEKEGNSTKLISNIKNNCLRKDDCQSLLSPRARTVPF